MNVKSATLRRILHKQYALPSEHGAWIWWIGPMLIGVAAGGQPGTSAILLFLAACLAFLSRQPTTMAVKALSGRRPRGDLAPSLFWLGLYAALSLAALLAIPRADSSRLIWLALPGLPVFAWHLWLVSRRAERGKRGVELAAAGVLALAAPAGYWSSGGVVDRTAWILWALTWLQSAASIVLVYQRLEQRSLAQTPPAGERWRAGRRTLLYHGFNALISLAMALALLVPAGVLVAFSSMLVDAAFSVARPPLGAKPRAIGLRQLAMSSLFTVLVSLSYLL